MADHHEDAFRRIVAAARELDDALAEAHVRSFIEIQILDTPSNYRVRQLILGSGNGRAGGSHADDGWLKFKPHVPPPEFTGRFEYKEKDGK